MKKISLITFILMLTLSILAKDTRVNVLDFKKYVKAYGTSGEDWQPAFQKAAAAAFKGNNILYVPAGKYKVRKTIKIYDALQEAGKKLTFSFCGQALKIVGDGRFNSVIWQMNPTQDLIDWSGPAKRKNIHVNNFNGGEIKDIWLRGGKICLKAVHHNRFKVSSCYITGSKYAGIYTSGWSNTFSDLTIRHCYNYGILAKGHMNDTTFKDIYMQNCDVGLMVVAGTGVRISNVGIEGCTYTGITVHGVYNLTIRDSYFEGNAITGKKTNASQIKKYGLGAIAVKNVKNMQINGCVFRGTANLTGFINIGPCFNASIQYNAFQMHKQEAGFYFYSESDKASQLSRITVKNNMFWWAYTKYAKKMQKAGTPVKNWYYVSSEKILKYLSSNNDIEELKKYTQIRSSLKGDSSAHKLDAFQ